MSKRIAVVLKGYPRLSETFIAQELRELEIAGYELAIISLRHPTDKHQHPIHGEIRAARHYLPEYLHHEPVRVAMAELHCLFRRHYWTALRAFCRDFLRDLTRNRIRRFGQAMVMAREYCNDADHIYVHFLHTPASVVRYAGLLTGKRYSISAHAKDIWTIPDWEIREKLQDCEWLVTCTASGAAHLRQMSPPGKVHLVYHGLDLERFPPPAVKKRKPRKPLQILTVGRAVPKKGLDTLLKALRKLPENLAWHWIHIGGGPQRSQIIRMAEELGIADRCEFKGALPQESVLDAYRNADVFVLPSRVDETGDRDGLPNVLLEAQSQRLAVVSTNVSAIPELVEDGKTGLLVEPDNPGELAEAIAKLANDTDLREALAKAGEVKVRGSFSHHATIGKLVSLLETSLNARNA